MALRWLLVTFLSIFSASGLNPNCHIHDPRPSEDAKTVQSPSQVLPFEATTAWLDAIGGSDAVKSSYKLAKASCQRRFEMEDKENTTVHADHPPPYGTNGDIPMGGETRLRGRRMLQDLTGAVLVPFGDAGHECPTYHTCWVGVLSCGRPRIAALQVSTWPLPHPLTPPDGATAWAWKRPPSLPLDLSLTLHPLPLASPYATGRTQALGVDLIRKELQRHRPGETLPPMGRWTVRAVNVRMRVSVPLSLYLILFPRLPYFQHAHAGE